MRAVKHCKPVHLLWRTIVTFEQFTKRFNEMFPDRRLWDETKELGLDRIQAIDGDSKAEIYEKLAFSVTMSICTQLIEVGEEITDDLTDALMDIKEQVNSKPMRESFTIQVNRKLFVTPAENLERQQ